MGIFDKLFKRNKVQEEAKETLDKGLEKTKENFFSKIGKSLVGKSVVDEEVLDEVEEVTGCHKIKVEFKAGESPLEGGETKYSCFYPTDQLLQDSSRVFHGSERTASSGRGGRGRGRGRGRGGRGGREGRPPA